MTDSTVQQFRTEYTVGITTGIIFCHNTLRTPVTAQLTLVLRAISGCQKQLLIPLHRHKHKQDSKHWNIRREGIEGARTYTTPPKLSTLSSCIAYIQNDRQFFRRRSNQSLFPSSLHSFKRTAWSSSKKRVLKQLQTTRKKHRNSWAHAPDFRTQSKLHFILSQSRSR